MDKNLRMSLIGKWFEMTKPRIKKEDYRDVTPYWCNRFLLHNGKSMPKIWWYYNFFQGRSMQKTIISLKGNTSFKIFKSNIMTLGYPKSGDTEKILKLEHAGIEIRTGNTEWGAEPGKLYFVIKHGEIINK